MLYLIILFILLILLAFIIVNIAIQCQTTKYTFGGNNSNHHYLNNRSLHSNLYAVTATSMLVTYTISGEGNGLDYSILRKSP